MQQASQARRFRRLSIPKPTTRPQKSNAMPLHGRDLGHCAQQWDNATHSNVLPNTPKLQLGFFHTVLESTFHLHAINESEHA